MRAETLAAALALHRAGRLEDAERAYGAALAHAPDHPAALQGLGVLHHQRGRSDLAVPLLARAALAAPGPEASFNLGLALLRLGEAARAAEALADAARRRPAWPEAHYNLALARLAEGRGEAARASLRQALRLRPDDPQAATNLGNLLLEDGAYEAAEALFRRAIAAAPQDPLPWNSLGAARLAQSDGAGAEAAFVAALARQPDLAEALGNLGALVIRESGRREEGEALLRRAVQGFAGRPESALAEADALRALGRHEAARAALARAPRPGWRHALLQAELLRLEGRLAEAEAALPRSVPPAAAAELAQARGVLRRDQYRLAEAEAALRDALRRRKHDLRAAHNLGQTLLTAGRMAEGFRLLEARIPLCRRAVPAAPPWDGTSAAPVLVLPEEGFGDVIQFARFLPEAAATGAALRFAAPPALARLFATLSSPVEIVTDARALAPGETWAMIMSLPHLLRAADPAAPRGAYLHADPAAARAWRERLPGPRRVGLAWAGNPAHELDHLRSIDPAALAPLGAVPGITWVSLQTARARPAPPFPLIEPDPAPADFADTAALIAALDLVIAVDSAVAHLAGALGKPVWLLNRFSSDWRWQRGDRPVWYAGLREFRQPTPRDWSTPIHHAAAALGSA